MAQGRNYFTVQMPGTVKEWSGIVAAGIGCGIPVIGSVWAAWSSLTAQNAQHDQRLAVIERTMTSVEQRVFRMEDALIGAGHGRQAALRIEPEPSSLPEIPGVPGLYAEWDRQ